VSRNRTNETPERIRLTLRDGVVIIGADAHYWPGDNPIMHRALLKFIAEFRSDKTLRTVIMNGDVLDLPTISRFDQSEWQHRPDVADELDYAILKMREIEDASGDVPKLLTIGNHDERLGKRLAARAPEFENVPGTRLSDHFPAWRMCWSISINNGDVLVKHSHKGGAHAPYNNARDAGCSVVTGHLHSAKIEPFTFHGRTAYGVDCGCIADVDGPQFSYLQGSPRDWRAGFAILTFSGGELLCPELVLGAGARCVQFRGRLYKV
jgi:hypothetical protein